MTAPPTIADIEVCKYLDLREVVGTPGGDREAIATLLTCASPIDHGASDRTFEVTWARCIAFAITDETYSLGESVAPLSGVSLFQEFRSSKFLEYIASTTRDLFEGERRHWGIYCLDHCIDVVSTIPPTIRLINSL